MVCGMPKYILSGQKPSHTVSYDVNLRARIEPLDALDILFQLIGIKGITLSPVIGENEKIRLIRRLRNIAIFKGSSFRSIVYPIFN